MGAHVLTAPHLRSWSASHAGTKRSHNEDAYVDRPDMGMFAVADGAGGHQAGVMITFSAELAAAFAKTP